ncbi:MAG: DUF1080 domain-containing protein [Pedosphaera sp.]|nr:DUF1080 domain-containing protein [Pedosphaera sp.]
MKRLQQLLAAAAALAVAHSLHAADAKKSPGYDDTPVIPGQTWKVHDSKRPHPPVVKPEASPTLGAKPPAGATVLFDGADLSKWKSAKGDAPWKVENGYAEVNGKGQITTKDGFGSMRLHIEFASPKEVKGESQGRGNSGVFLMGMYEVQVLDSYENVTYADGQCASLYGQWPPDKNVCLPPGEWQTYDITFEAPKFKDGKLVEPGYVTVIHNGVKVHDRRKLNGPSGHRSVVAYKAHADKLPISLQDHGNPVRFRNMWLEEIK